MKTEISIGIICVIALLLSGCTKFKIPVSNGQYIVYEKGWTDTQADWVEFRYKAPNVAVWLVVNDPNGNVHPGRIFIPPYVMVESK